MNNYENAEPLNINLGTNIITYKSKSERNEDILIHSIDSDSPQVLLKRLKTRSDIEHPNLVKFHDFYQDSTTKCVLLITEDFLGKSLNDFIAVCRQQSKYLREETVCRVLYQILCTVKTVNGFREPVDGDVIFLDERFDVKLFNFGLGTYTNGKKTKMSQIARLVCTMCSLEPFEKKPVPSSHYSSQFSAFLQNLLKDKGSLSRSIDRTLCNATLLLKSSQFAPHSAFILCEDRQHTILRLKEDLLREKEFELNRRERRIVELERSLEEKLARLELEEIDENCDDSGIVVTRKGKPFNRSKSERRVKFKGHSPLKQMNFNRTKRNSTKPLFQDFPRIDEEHCKSRPISWNRESKRHAFDLLRIMNGTITGDHEIKHTFL